MSDGAEDSPDAAAMVLTAPPRRSEYRLYVDEVGHAAVKPVMSEEERYLTLVGIACELRHVYEVIQPEMHSLKERYFRNPLPSGFLPDPDEAPRPIIFHRCEMASRRYPFAALRDRSINDAFDAELLTFLRRWKYTVFSVTVDKEAMQKQYHTMAHPYHYGLEILVERYTKWLEIRKSLGDVLAEARGGKADRELEQEYTRLYENGTFYVKLRQGTDHASALDNKIA